MMWQKCPICNGSGKEIEYRPASTAGDIENICSVCGGQKIINKKTGFPPLFAEGFEIKLDDNFKLSEIRLEKEGEVLAKVVNAGKWKE